MTSTLAKWSYCKVKPLQIEAIAEWRHSTLFYSYLYFIRISWELKQLSFNLSFKHVRAINIITSVFFDLLPSFIAPISQSRLVFGPRTIFPNTNQKNSYHYLNVIWFFIMNETELLSYADSNTTYSVANDINGVNGFRAGFW